MSKSGGRFVGVLEYDIAPIILMAATVVLGLVMSGIIDIQAFVFYGSVSSNATPYALFGYTYLQPMLTLLGATAILLFKRGYGIKGVRWMHLVLFFGYIGSVAWPAVYLAVETPFFYRCVFNKGDQDAGEIFVCATQKHEFGWAWFMNAIAGLLLPGLGTLAHAVAGISLLTVRKVFVNDTGAGGLAKLTKKFRDTIGAGDDEEGMNSGYGYGRKDYTESDSSDE